MTLSNTLSIQKFPEMNFKTFKARRGILLSRQEGEIFINNINNGHKAEKVQNC